LDADQDDIGNACDDDMDGDSITDSSESEECTWNRWSDCSGTHSDTDNIPDAYDNCPSIDNPCQADIDDDGIGDECDTDTDGDGTDDNTDTCPDIANADQTDTDGDGYGDACDVCPDISDDQSDLDDDGEGDACDEDADGDELVDSSDADPDGGTDWTYWYYVDNSLGDMTPVIINAYDNKYEYHSSVDGVIDGSGKNTYKSCTITPQDGGPGMSVTTDGICVRWETGISFMGPFTGPFTPWVP